MQPRPLKRFKRLVRYLLLRVVFALFGLLPLRVAISLGGALGRLGFRLAGRERRKSLASLAIAFPDDAKRKSVKAQAEGPLSTDEEITVISRAVTQAVKEIVSER